MIGRPSGKAALLGGAAAVVVLAVGAALWLAESPMEQRQRRLDARRITDLQKISAAVDVHRGRHGELPARLADLEAGNDLTEHRHDPDGRAYGYRVTGAKTYELCATFATEWTDDSPWGYSSREQFWAHPAGEHCFELESKDVKP